MDDLAKTILNQVANELYDSHKRSYQVTVHQESIDYKEAGISFNQIDRTVAKRLNVGDDYVTYSIERRCPSHKDFIHVQKVLKKMMDEQGNIIIVTDVGESFNL